MTSPPVHRRDVDVAIVGSGFAGSLMALALRARGHSVLLLERGSHPRFAIGESSTPLANVLLEQLCDRYGLEQVRPLSAWGSWQRTYPQIGCGLKRGFSFFHHRPGHPFDDDASRTQQLLVAASPHDDAADTHWYRPDFDAHLATDAQRAGAMYLDQAHLTGMREHMDRVDLEGTRHGVPLDVRARFVIDASGPRGFVHRALGLGEAPLRWLPATQGLYAHFADVHEWADVNPVLTPDEPPYPVDAAALHHVFPGGWIWVLRFANGITSAGAALTDPVAQDIGAADGQAAWHRLLDRFPSIRAQFDAARAVTPFVHTPRLAFRSGQVVGARWALLPSAAGVIDPLLSTGFVLTLLGVHRLLHVLERGLARRDPEPAFERDLDEYARATTRELDATEQLVGALYAAMDDSEMFTRLALLYFAAASFSETARRLGRGDRARGFLLCDDELFGPAIRACTARAAERPQGATRYALLAQIDRAIEPLDVAGLGDRARRGWYPVRADDLLGACGKIGATEAEMEQFLDRVGMADAKQTL